MTNCSVDREEYLQEQIAISPPAVREHITDLKRSLRYAADEIVRLNDVIEQHVMSASVHVVSNFNTESITTLDVSGMRTRVRVSPMLHEFYLAESMGGWSEDHRRAFHKMVVRGFSEGSAEKIAESIWTAPAQRDK